MQCSDDTRPTDSKLDKAKSDKCPAPNKSEGLCDNKLGGCQISSRSVLATPVEDAGLMGNNMQNNLSPSTGPARGRDTLTPHNKYVVASIQFVSVLLVLFYFIIPGFIKIYPSVIVDVAFLNHIRWPPFLDLEKPQELGLNGTLNFHLEMAQHEITIGAWHIVPEKLRMQEASASDANYAKLLNDDNPIILYLHGNAGTRAAWHRVQLYKVLSKAGYHVVTFDYRGYGDSTGHPSEDGLVEDSVFMYKWIKSHSGKSPVYIWGHSLGSAVATKTARKLNEAGETFEGLILESPFNNFVEAASNHPFTAPFRIMPWFTWVFIEGIKANNIRFASDENIAGVAVKTLILHATDDGIVPYELGRKLYDAAIRNKKTGSVEFVTFEGVHGYGHKHIHKAPNLPEIIRKFTSS